MNSLLAGELDSDRRVGDFRDAVLSEVRSWLDGGKADPARLAQWLKGDLAIGETGQEPYVFLLQAVAAGGSCVEKGMVSAAVEILNSSPEAVKGDRQERLLYNLLRLCAGLESPEELAAPLLGMLRRQALSARYNGLDLRNDLRAALARNQAEPELRDVWRAMLDGRDAGFLPGSVRDGFEGIVRMPAADGEPAQIEDVIYGLDRVIPLLEADHDSEQERDEDFADLLGQVKSVWAWGGLEGELLPAAGERKWPRWVAERLGRRAVQDSITIAEAREAMQIALDNDLESNPYPSSRSVLGVMHHAAMELAEKHRRDSPIVASRLEEAADWLKQTLGLPTA